MKLNLTKIVSIIALVASFLSLAVSVFGERQAVSTDEINRLVDARLIQREQELVNKYKPKLQQIEEDFGLTPSDPKNLEDMARSLGRIVLMSK